MKTTTMNTRSKTGSALSADTIIGTPVVNRSDEGIGNIKDLMLDVDHGRIRYAVLDFGGVLGVGNKLFAVPFEAFTVDRDNERFVLEADKEMLKNASGFDQNDWPDFADERFERQIYDHYGVRPYWHNS